MTTSDNTAVLEALRENNDRILALVDNFEALYDVDLATGDYEVYVKGQTYSESISTKLVAKNEFFSDCLKNFATVIYQEDRSSLALFVNREFIMKALEKAPRFDWRYRVLVDGEPVWFRLRIVYKDPSHRRIILGVFNAEEEMKEQKASEAVARQRREIIKTMLGGESLYVVDTETERYEVIQRNEYLEATYPQRNTFTESFREYIAKDVFAPDREKMEKTFNLGTILEELRYNRRYSVEYRDMSRGIPHWYRAQAVRITDSEIMIGFADRDRKILEKQVIDKIAKDIFALFVVDLEDGGIKIIKKSPWYDVGEEGKSAPYVQQMQRFAELFTGDVREMFLRLSDVNYVQEELMQKPKVSFTYRSTNIGGNRWVKVLIYALRRHKNGYVASFALSFSFMDELAQERAERREKLERVMGKKE